MLTASQLRQLYFDFFIARGHKLIPSAPLVPENDPSTLFTSSGIQPLVPYFLGQPHPYGTRLVDVQNCIRTSDIEEVGDPVHHTFFEMLGNWSLGDYFKKEIIPWSFELLTQKLNIPVNKLAVTVFAGDTDAPRDNEAIKLWLEQGIPIQRIIPLPKENNWWGPPGVTGPCGTDTEMFYWTGADQPPEVFDPKDNRWVEIWNDVLIQYFKNDQGKYEKLVQNNIDTGMGVERTIAVLNGFSDNYLTSIWQPIITKISELSHSNYQDNLKAFRIIADHLRTAVFMIAVGIEPSNKEAGYVLRRVIRRAIRQGKLLGIETNFTKEVAASVLDNQPNYAGVYPELDQNKNKIFETLETEEIRFRKTLDRGLREIEKYTSELGVVLEGKAKHIRYNDIGKQAFYFYESFGFPLEMFIEEMKGKIILDKEEIEKSFNDSKNEHTKQSQTLSAGKFKAGLADHSEITTKYHTATHLLHAALRQILGNHVQQKGSNITVDRLRFDFSHPDKLTDEQLRQIEDLVNEKISTELPVIREEKPKDEAIAQGALAFFGHKYPDIVSIYSIGDFSKELCGGPHVSNTSEIGKIRLVKQEAVGSNTRRLYLQLV